MRAEKRWVSRSTARTVAMRVTTQLPIDGAKNTGSVDCSSASSG